MNHGERKSSGCPDPETLGVFLEGRLQPEQRRQLTEHLSRCEDCRLLAAEADAFLTRASASTAAPWAWRKVTPWLAAAAALLLVFFLWRPDSDPSGPNLALLPAEPLIEELWEFPIAPGFAPTLTLEQLSFRIGVAGTDLQIAHQASASEECTRVVRRLLESAPASSFPRSHARLREILGENAGCDLEADSLRTALRAESVQQHYDLGAWGEAVRLAAIERQVAFLTAEDTLGFFTEIDATALSPAVRRSTERLALLLGQGPGATGWTGQVEEVAAELLVVGSGP